MTNVTRRSITALSGVVLAWLVWPAGAEEKKGVPLETIVQAQIAADKDAVDRRSASTSSTIRRARCSRSTTCSWRKPRA